MFDKRVTCNSMDSDLYSSIQTNEVKIYQSKTVVEGNQTGIDNSNKTNNIIINNSQPQEKDTTIPSGRKLRI